MLPSLAAYWATQCSAETQQLVLRQLLNERENLNALSYIQYSFYGNRRQQLVMISLMNTEKPLGGQYPRLHYDPY